MTFAEKLALFDRLVVNAIAIALTVAACVFILDAEFRSPPTVDPNPVCHLVPRP